MNLGVGRRWATASTVPGFYFSPLLTEDREVQTTCCMAASRIPCVFVYKKNGFSTHPILSLALNSIKKKLYISSPDSGAL
jgi:hypothetical protein